MYSFNKMAYIFAALFYVTCLSLLTCGISVMPFLLLLTHDALITLFKLQMFKTAAQDEVDLLGPTAGPELFGSRELVSPCCF